MANTTHVSLRLPCNLVDQVDAEARRESRSRAKVIELHLRGVYEAGYGAGTGRRVVSSVDSGDGGREADTRDAGRSGIEHAGVRVSRSDDVPRKQAGSSGGVKVGREDDGGRVKPDLANLRSICDGNFPMPVPESSAFLEDLQDITKSNKLCQSCEEPLEMIKGKLVCMDQSCGMRGVEQKGKR